MNGGPSELNYGDPRLSSKGWSKTQWRCGLAAVWAEAAIHLIPGTWDYFMMCGLWIFSFDTPERYAGTTSSTG